MSDAILWRWRLTNTPVKGAVLVHRTPEGELIGQVLQRREIVGFSKPPEGPAKFSYSPWADVPLEDPDGIAPAALA